jgi:hypothetical protein
MGFDGRPIVVFLEDGFVVRVGLSGVPGDEDGLGHRRVNVLEDRQEQRGAPE